MEGKVNISGVSSVRRGVGVQGRGREGEAITFRIRLKTWPDAANSEWRGVENYSRECFRFINKSGYLAAGRPISRLEFTLITSESLHRWPTVKCQYVISADRVPRFALSSVSFFSSFLFSPK